MNSILVVGNMGYVGPVVVSALRNHEPQARLQGLDTGFFSGCLTIRDLLPERVLANQWFMDIRDVSETFMEGFDTIVYLAAVSNDPIGEEFKNATYSVNYEGACRFARIAKRCGVKRFVFASSCSMYGASGDGAKTESMALNPLTTYAKTKVDFERFLAGLADESFVVTALRFATACGMSPRIRLDLVLNDFVASAHVTRTIRLLSDGKAWRPLIDVHDMGQAVVWAANRKPDDETHFLPVNTGRNDWNFKIIDLARIVAELFGNVELVVGDNVADKRTYKVDFGNYEQMARHYLQPRSVVDTIDDIRRGLHEFDFNDSDFRNSSLMRLNALKKLKNDGLLDENLRWL